MKKSIFKILILALSVTTLFCTVACGESNEEESSVIPESSGPNVHGDSVIEDTGETSESEESRAERLQELAKSIRSTNTVYTKRFKKFVDTLTTTDYSLRYRYTTSANADYIYDIVRKGDDFYYKMSVTDVNGNESHTEYYSKNGIGYEFDDENKLCIVYSNSKSIDNVLPIITGVKFQEQKVKEFNGNEYSCDSFKIISGRYTESMTDLEARETGTLDVFYDSEDNVIGMIEVLTEDGYTQNMTIGKFRAADVSVFSKKKGYTEISEKKYYEVYNELQAKSNSSEEEE